jgi:molecular chaperone DnaK
MSGDTINAGIDLGTTNSSIALWLDDGRIETVRNGAGSDSTPSIVCEDRHGSVRVGITAKNAMAAGEENVFLEFKQRMGRTTEFRLPASGRILRPEDLSAEVLKSLKADVRRERGIDLTASVITIPAAFGRSEIAATNLAGRLAGFDVTPLCLEPIAAALAYSHAGYDLAGYSIVFDMGGGTTDAAIVRRTEQDFELINHAGDTHLGGKLIDYAILDEIVAPAIRQQYGVDLQRGDANPAVRIAYARLKAAVESAKIGLSEHQQTELDVPNLFVDANGHGGDFYFTLSRSQVEAISEPLIAKAINMCKRALLEKRLAPGDVDRILLVGGPARMPLLQEMLEDLLEAPLQRGIDPVTVVAQGAAVFGRSQRIPGRLVSHAPSGVAIDLRMDHVGVEKEPVAGGRLQQDGREDFGRCEVTFRSAVWQSGRIPVMPSGAFLTQLLAVEGENRYDIAVYMDGTLCESTPSQVIYLREAIFADIPLTHTISVALANNSVDPVFQKMQSLPVRTVRDYTTTTELIAGDGRSRLLIPLLEGSDAKADRNLPIGFIRITGEQVRRSVPRGSRIEFTLAIDTSQRLVADAYVTALDEHFRRTIDLTKPDADLAVLENEVTAELGRVRDLRKRIDEEENEDACDLMDQLAEERLVEQLERELPNLANRDTADLVLNRLRDLRLVLDEVEGILQWPSLEAEARDWLRDTRDKSRRSAYATDADRRQCEDYATLLVERCAARDVDGVRRLVADLRSLYWDINRRDPRHWVRLLNDLRDEREDMRDKGLADELFRQGDRCVAQEDTDGVRSAARQLLALLPDDRAEELGGFGSTVMTRI